MAALTWDRQRTNPFAGVASMMGVSNRGFNDSAKALRDALALSLIHI